MKKKLIRMNSKTELLNYEFKKILMKKYIENYFGDSNCQIDYDKAGVLKIFDEKTQYKSDFDNYSKTHNLDYIYIEEINNHEKVKFYKDGYPLLKLRKKILLIKR